jgi:flagellar protein FliS
LANPNPYQKYRQTQVETSRSHDLILMLYDGAIKTLHQINIHLEAKNLELVHQGMIKAQNIVLELSASLNYDAGEVADQLGLVYDYMYRRLLEANMKKDSEIVDEVLAMAKELRETWKQAIQLAKAGQR